MWKGERERERVMAGKEPTRRGWVTRSGALFDFHFEKVQQAECMTTGAIIRPEEQGKTKTTESNQEARKAKDATQNPDARKRRVVSFLNPL